MGSRDRSPAGTSAAAVQPRGPYPILILNGEQGTAKSTTSRVMRKLIDPHVTSLRNFSSEERDLMIAAANSGRCVLIDASSEPQAIHRAVLAAVEERLGVRLRAIGEKGE